MWRRAKNTKEPIFVCGMARSGTSWVSETLGQSSELVYLDEAWLIDKLQELVDWHSMMYDDWAGFTPWKQGGIDRTKFVRSLSRFYEDLLGMASGGKRFIEKTPEENALHLKLLNELFPNAYYVLIYRDGRNYVASLEEKKRNENKEFDFANACRKWARSMDVFEEILSRKAIKNFTVIRYEDLLLRFEPIFRELCGFVMIEPFKPKPFAPNSSFRNSRSPDDFNQRWAPWSEERIKTFKDYAGAQLLKWKYAESI